MKIYFTKMQSLGNDFMVIDATHRDEPLTIPAATISQFAHRHQGIGFDQLLIIESTTQSGYDYIYRIFNADGSEVGQCGNGARCVAHYIHTKGLDIKRDIHLKTLAGKIITTKIADGRYCVNMGAVTFEPSQIPFSTSQKANSYILELDNDSVEIYPLAIGNPHCVIRVVDIDSAPVATLGKLISHHPQFPSQVNVSFMQVINEDEIKLRVYERGVGETLACGSGACASAVIAQQQQWVKEQVVVNLPGGELSIYWQGDNTPVMMTGPAGSVFDGVIRY